MRMMKNNNNETVMVLGIDHGYGNMKTATVQFNYHISVDGMLYSVPYEYIGVRI